MLHAPQDNVDQLQQCLVTLVELVQGNVSRGNSQTLVGCKCIELLGRLIQSDVLEGLSSDMRDEVRASVANLLSAMLEGNNDAVKERMKTVLDLKGMLKLCNSYYASAQSLKQQLLPDGLPLATTKDLFVLQADNDGMSRASPHRREPPTQRLQLPLRTALFARATRVRVPLVLPRAQGASALRCVQRAARCSSTRALRSSCSCWTSPMTMRRAVATAWMTLSAG
eukprot:2063092-Prymnesium_polylepis.2